jgi:hypothetical protein
MSTTAEVSEPAGEPESGLRSVFHCPAVPLTVRDRPWTVPGAQVSAAMRADWRLTARPMATTEQSDLLTAGDKQASPCSGPLVASV